MKVIYIATIVFVSFFLFTACGGEDCEGDECYEPIDDNEFVDEATDETVDEVTDETIDEVVDEDNNPPIACTDNQYCMEVCKNFLDMEGKWSVVIPTAVSGEINLTLSVSGENCKIVVTNKWEFTWEGTEIHQMYCIKNANNYSFFSLQEMEGEKLVIKKYESEESCEYDGGTPYKFEKIQ